MKAVTYQKQHDTFTVTEQAAPTLETPFDVLVKVHAVGLNPVDYKINSWHMALPDMDDHFVAGLDVSGEIVEVGGSVSDWQVGDRVLYHGNMFRAFGGFAEYAIHDSRTLTPHPDTSAEIAAASPCAGWTAWRALVDKLDIASRSRVFIAGGAGGVGSFAIQIARHFGVKAIITTASAHKHDYVKQLGATHAIDYHQDNVVQQVLDITGDAGVEASLDCVGGDNDKLCAAVLGFEGHMAEIVKLVAPEQYDNAFGKALSFHQVALGSGHAHGPKSWQDIVSAGTALSGLLTTGDVSVPMLEVISLEQIPEKLAAMSNQRTTGKIVARIAS